LLKALPSVRSLREVLDDPLSWKGSMRQLFESIARDNQQPQDIRLMCAGVLIRDEQPAEPQLTPEERRRRIDELLRKRDGGPTLIGTATDTASATHQPNPPLIEGRIEPSHKSANEPESELTAEEQSKVEHAARTKRVAIARRLLEIDHNATDEQRAAGR
jgi:hypothetical protein